MYEIEVIQYEKNAYVVVSGLEGGTAQKSDFQVLEEIEGKDCCNENTMIIIIV